MSRFVCIALLVAEVSADVCGDVGYTQNDWGVLAGGNPKRYARNNQLKPTQCRGTTGPNGMPCEWDESSWGECAVVPRIGTTDVETGDVLFNAPEEFDFNDRRDTRDTDTLNTGCEMWAKGRTSQRPCGMIHCPIRPCKQSCDGGMVYSTGKGKCIPALKYEGVDHYCRSDSHIEQFQDCEEYWIAHTKNLNRRRNLLEGQ